MPVRPILRFPDPRLKMRCAPVEVFDQSLRVLVADLLETMRAAPGVGITAAHIGVLLRIFVLELSPEDGVRIFVNPQLLDVSRRMIRHTEGSVSMPGANDEVERPQTVRLRYQDLDGIYHEEEADDFLAICIQHEIDQLDGIFWLQRLSRLKRERLIRRWEKQNGV